MIISQSAIHDYEADDDCCCSDGCCSAMEKRAIHDAMVDRSHAAVDVAED